MTAEQKQAHARLQQSLTVRTHLKVELVMDRHRRVTQKMQERMLEYRTRKNAWSIRAIAKVMGLPISTVGDYLSGKRSKCDPA